MGKKKASPKDSPNAACQIIRPDGSMMELGSGVPKKQLHAAREGDVTAQKQLVLRYKAATGMNAHIDWATVNDRIIAEP